MFTIRVDDEIQLRLYEEWHAQPLFDLCDNDREHIGRFLGWMKYTNSVEDSLKFIWTARKNFANGRSIQMGIIYKGDLVGSAGVHVHNKMAGIGEIGYWLGSAYTGKGIMTRAVRTLLDYAFDVFELNRVIIRCDVRNNPSCAIPTRLNFTHEGVHREAIYVNDQYCDINVFSMLADEWTVNTTPILEHRVDDDISIRLYEGEHAEPLFKLVDANREYLREWLNWVDTTRSRADTQAFIIGGLDQYARNDGFQAGIWYQGELVGSIGFHRWSFLHRTTEIGYWLSESHMGKGIMTRAVKAMVKIAFNDVNLNRVVITCAVDNDRSCSIPERLGFTHESVARAYELVNGEHLDSNKYALLKREWRG